MNIKHRITAKYQVVALRDTEDPRDFFLEPRDLGNVEPRNGGYEAHEEKDCDCDCAKCSKKDETKD